jgi:very-short-patch-repair endonuclease
MSVPSSSLNDFARYYREAAQSFLAASVIKNLSLSRHQNNSIDIGLFTNASPFFLEGKSLAIERPEVESAESDIEAMTNLLDSAESEDEDTDANTTSIHEPQLSLAEQRLLHYRRLSAFLTQQQIGAVNKELRIGWPILQGRPLRNGKQRNTSIHMPLFFITVGGQENALRKQIKLMPEGIVELNLSALFDLVKDDDNDLHVMKECARRFEAQEGMIPAADEILRAHLETVLGVSCPDPLPTYGSGQFDPDYDGALKVSPAAMLVQVSKGAYFTQQDLQSIAEASEELTGQDSVARFLFSDNNVWDTNPSEEELHPLAPAGVVFPLEASEVQNNIGAMINAGARLVQVDGPPGTGKSHTIANLVAHLVAQEKSVLVTSDKYEALKVVNDKLAQIQTIPFSVALLGDKLSDRKVFANQLGKITQRQMDKRASSQLSAARREHDSQGEVIRSLDERLSQAIERDLEATRLLREARADAKEFWEEGKAERIRTEDLSSIGHVIQSLVEILPPEYLPLLAEYYGWTKKHSAAVGAMTSHNEYQIHSRQIKEELEECHVSQSRQIWAQQHPELTNEHLVENLELAEEYTRLKSTHANDSLVEVLRWWGEVSPDINQLAAQIREKNMLSKVPESMLRQARQLASNIEREGLQRLWSSLEQAESRADRWGDNYQQLINLSSLAPASEIAEAVRDYSSCLKQAAVELTPNAKNLYDLFEGEPYSAARFARGIYLGLRKCQALPEVEDRFRNLADYEAQLLLQFYQDGDRHQLELEHLLSESLATNEKLAAAEESAADFRHGLETMGAPAPDTLVGQWEEQLKHLRIARQLIEQLPPAPEPMKVPMEHSKELHSLSADYLEALAKTFGGGTRKKIHQRMQRYYPSLRNEEDSVRLMRDNLSFLDLLLRAANSSVQGGLKKAEVQSLWQIRGVQALANLVNQAEEHITYQKTRHESIIKDRAEKKELLHRLEQEIPLHYQEVEDLKQQIEKTESEDPFRSIGEILAGVDTVSLVFRSLFSDAIIPMLSLYMELDELYRPARFGDLLQLLDSIGAKPEEVYVQTFLDLKSCREAKKLRENSPLLDWAERMKMSPDGLVEFYEAKGQLLGASPFVPLKNFSNLFPLDDLADLSTFKAALSSWKGACDVALTLGNEESRYAWIPQVLEESQDLATQFIEYERIVDLQKAVGGDVLFALQRYPRLEDVSVQTDVWWFLRQRDLEEKIADLRQRMRPTQHAYDTLTSQMGEKAEVFLADPISASEVNSQLQRLTMLTRVQDFIEDLLQRISGFALQFTLEDWQAAIHRESARREYEKIRRQLESDTDEIMRLASRFLKGHQTQSRAVVDYTTRSKVAKIHGKQAQQQLTTLQLLLTKKTKRQDPFGNFQYLRDNFSWPAILEAIPAWIMSLEDVARLTPMEAQLFDVVIIDEASQCTIPQGLPALLRGSSAVVFGDKKQLNPHALNFYPPAANLKARQDYDIDRIDQARLFDVKENSLLDLCKARAQVSYTLNEHFRCQPEIIDYCRQTFYSADPNDEGFRVMTENRKSPLDFPTVSTCHVEIDPEAEQGVSHNAPEAEALYTDLKKLVKRLGESTATSSMDIGILSPSRKQVSYLQSLLYEYLAPGEVQQHRIAIATFDEFQGNERDIIYYSLHARPGQGAGTTVRGMKDEIINVGLSRAAYHVKVFHSLSPAAYGKLAPWVSYCTDPSAGVPQVHADHFDSEFERQVCLALRSSGLDVYTQIPSCGYRIDLVAEDDEGSKMAVECDGMYWHAASPGSERLKDRDIYRQNVLERAGWKFVRISDLQWEVDPQECIDRVLSSF